MLATDGQSEAPWGVSLVYITHRPEPRFEWFADALARQLEPGDEVDVILVDGRFSAERGARFAAQAGGRFGFSHVPAKPSPYNGPHRLTTTQYHACASARNTGIVHAQRPYVVFADDASVPMPGWWREARHAAHHGYVVAGAYKKAWEMEVVDGGLVASRIEPEGIDTRWELGSDEGIVRIGGGQLYGASFGAPRELLVAVNGADEICDSIGGEDYHLGIRMEFAGAPIFYSRRMLTIESEELHRQGEPLLRLDPTADPDTYMERLRRFGVEQRSTDGGFDSSHMILDLLYGARATRSVGNYYDLAELTPADLPGLAERLPELHWFDGRPLAEM